MNKKTIKKLSTFVTILSFVVAILAFLSEHTNLFEED